MTKKQRIKKINERIDELIGIYDAVVTSHNLLMDRVAALELKQNPIKKAPVQKQPDPRGLDLLFDKPQMYRHVCTKCKHHLVNQLPNGVQCTRCKNPMDSRLVTSRGKRGKYKPRAPMAKA